MILDKEAHRELLLTALKGLSVTWTLETSADATEKQVLIVELAEQVQAAETEETP